MNLHGIAKQIIAAVNPNIPLDVRISTGYSTDADGRRVPSYATPCSFMGSISGQTLTVVTMGSGAIQVGQTLFDEDGAVLPGTNVVALGTGAGGPGTYTLNNEQDVGLELIQSTLTILGQVQSLTFRDMQQLEGLNLQGDRKAVYFDGPVYGLVRPTNQGGDLVTLPDRTVWLVAQVIERWPDWSKAAVTLQNEIAT